MSVYKYNINAHLVGEKLRIAVQLLSYIGVQIHFGVIGNILNFRIRRKRSHAHHEAQNECGQ